MCIQWTHVLYSVVITRQSNPPISQFNSLCNEFTSVWSMFVYNTSIISIEQLKVTNNDKLHDSYNLLLPFVLFTRKHVLNNYNVI